MHKTRVLWKTIGAQVWAKQNEEVRAKIPGSVKVENMTDAVRHDGGSRASSDVPVKVVGVANLKGLVIDGEVGNIDARGGACYAVHGCSGARETLIHNL